MENLVNKNFSSSFWCGRRVFITGSTGFKGAWLSLSLAQRGAVLAGYALPPVQDGDLFNIARIEELCPTTIGDIRDAKRLADALRAFGPQTVFHLAAQPLVRRGYADPLETFSTNVMGTCNLLEAVRHLPSIESVVTVATDKCYRNREWSWGYRENDELGGIDPYSASKAAAELVTSSFRLSFFAKADIGLASARGGNVVGGGDFSDDRLIPDIVRAWLRDDEVVLRHPNATRPWQHVLDCLSGYIMLAEAVASERRAFSDAFNFGPESTAEVSVLSVLKKLSEVIPVRLRIASTPAKLHEASRLALDSSRAREQLGWRTKLDLDKTIQWTGAWYSRYFGGGDARKLMLEQIAEYQRIGL